MGRKSSVQRLPDDVRSHIEKRLRENRLTLDELIADLHQHFPAEDKPSRSALGRYRKNYDQLVGRMREQENVARLMVEELGENPDEKAGALLVQSITTLTTHAAFAAQEEETPDIATVKHLARAAKDVLQARKASIDERKEIERLAREKLISEQKEKLNALQQSGQISKDALAAVIKAAYDL